MFQDEARTVAKRPAGDVSVKTPKTKKHVKKPVVSVATPKTKKKLVMTRKRITCREYRNALNVARQNGKSEKAALAAASIAYGATGDKFDAAAAAAAASRRRR